MTKSRSDPTSFYYPPARAARVSMEEYERLKDVDIRLGWGVPPLDEYLIPMTPGDLISILGRPGHGKTSVLVHLARVALDAISKRDDNSLVIFATWETLVEEFVGVITSAESGQSLESIGRGTAKLEPIRKALAGVIGLKLAVFGRSMESPSGEFHNLEGLNEVLHSLKGEYGPALLLVDYLQRIPGVRGQDRSQRVSEHLEMLKDMALVHQVPTVVAVQSRRDVDAYQGLRIPALNDGQWSSNIEQTSDKVLGVTRPCLYLEEGTTIKSRGLLYDVGLTTFVMKVLKQRWAASGETFILGFDPPTAKVYQIEGRGGDPEPDDQGEMPF